MTSGTDKLTIHIVSDIHLNNKIYDKEKYPENPHGKVFREFLTDINKNINENNKNIIILNGDIIDITGSWFSSTMPWDDDEIKVEKILREVITKIIDNNIDVFNELKKFLLHPLSEVIYVIGNHDGALELYPLTQVLIKQKVVEKQEYFNKFKFVDFYVNSDLNLYVEHGHKLDPYNLYDSKQKPSMGDVVNVLIVNRVTEKAENKLKANGYPDNVINKIKHSLQDVEYLRPLSLLPLWAETISEKHREDSKNQKISLDQILRELTDEILLSKDIKYYVAKKLHIPIFFWGLLVKLTMSFPSILPLISFVCSRLVNRTHSNKFQFKKAKLLSKDKNYKFISFGHTHKPTLHPVAPDVFYFNTGSWTPLVNLFKYSEHEELQKELFHPEEYLRKIERCGIVKIEKDLRNSKSKPRFELKTIEGSFFS